MRGPRRRTTDAVGGKITEITPALASTTQTLSARPLTGQADGNGSAEVMRDGRHMCLSVVNRGLPQLSEHVYAAPSEDGSWWFWWSWAGLVVLARAMRTDSRVIWSRGKNGQPHQMSPFLDGLRDSMNGRGAGGADPREPGQDRDDVPAAPDQPAGYDPFHRSAPAADDPFRSPAGGLRTLAVPATPTVTRTAAPIVTCAAESRPAADRRSPVLPQ